MHTVRVNHAARKDAHECIQGIDTDLGRFGVYLNHPVIKTAAAAAIGQNLRRLGPLVLPFSEMVRSQGAAAKCCSRACASVSFHSMPYEEQLQQSSSFCPA